jgi:thiazole tautomerase (transcriptional regulator TenI)
VVFLCSFLEKGGCRVGELELHVISTGRQELHRVAELAGEMHAYAAAIHLREKARTIEEIARGVQLLWEAGVPLDKIRINGHVDASLALGVGGIHLPGDERSRDTVKRLGCGESPTFGVSVHSAQEAVEMEQAGAHYVLYGHIYETCSKPGALPRGIEGLSDVVRAVSIPVIAIGGITPERVIEVIRTGVKGIAVMSGILEAPNPLLAARSYAQALKDAEIQLRDESMTKQINANQKA